MNYINWRVKRMDRNKDLTLAEIEYLIQKCEDGIAFGEEDGICLKTIKYKLEIMLDRRIV